MEYIFSFIGIALLLIGSSLYAKTLEVTQQTEPTFSTKIANDKNNDLRLLAELPSNMSIVKYELHDTTLDISTISQHNFIKKTLKINSKELKNNLKKLHHHLDLENKKEKKKINEIAAEIYQLLVNPIENEINRSKTIGFISDPSLLPIPVTVQFPP